LTAGGPSNAPPWLNLSSCGTCQRWESQAHLQPPVSPIDDWVAPSPPAPLPGGERGAALTPSPSPTRGKGSAADFDKRFDKLSTLLNPAGFDRLNPGGFGTLAGARYISTNSMQAQPAPSLLVE
jgi:hypothetical protein